MATQRETVEELFEAALALKPEDRSAYLDKVGKSDPVLRQLVEELLSVDAKARSFLEHPPFGFLDKEIAPGTKIGPYEIVALIGSGGMGEVFRARDSTLKREVAIKVLPAYVAQDPERLRRFEHEAQAAAALNHSNILAVYQFGMHEDAPYLVSELLEGETLRQVLRRGPLPLRKALDYAVQIAHGLAAAHEKGIIHRDLKPENLFVTKDGGVKILDFGLAKLKQAGENQPGATESGVVMGTAGYMSPEQVRGEHVDHRADIFAFGVILYEMLSGKRAFHRATSAETMTAILNEDPPEIPASMPDTPPALVRLVHRCMEKSSERRLQSALDLAFDLEEMTGSGATVAANGAGGGVVAKPLRRKPRSLAMWLLGVLLLVGLVIAGWYLMRPRPTLHMTFYTQITHEGSRKGLIGTDGSRLYVNQWPKTPTIVQVAISGGAMVPVAIALPDPLLLNISPDGSNLLVTSQDGDANSLWSVEMPGGSLRHLTNGIISSAVWSPDAKSVAYSTEDGEIFVMRSDGTEIRRLVAKQGYRNAFAMAWSPDGNTIRFSRDDKLWELSADGSGLHQFLPDWRLSSWKCCGRWTPDGRFFIFVSRDLVGGQQLWALDERRRQFGHASNEPFPLTSGPLRWGVPSPSKDGRRIFAQGFIQRGELLRYDAQSHQLQPYLGGISAQDISFSPNGQFIAYVTWPDGILWRANRDGSNPVQLTDPPIYPALPSWSTDSTEIAYSDMRDSDRPRSYFISPNGGTARPLLPEGEKPQSDPNWSPDGKKIIFGSGEFDHSTENLCILDLASQQIITVPGSNDTYSPRWSPNGQLVAGLSSSTHSLKVFDFNSQRWTLLQKGFIGYPYWSHDGQFIYYLRPQDEPGVYRIRVSGGNAERVVDLKGFRQSGLWGFWMGLDPTGAPLLLRRMGTDDIYALNLEEK